MRAGPATVIAAAVTAATLLVGCSSGPPELVQPSPTGAVVNECVAVMGALPAQVMGHGEQTITGNVATWGEQLISLRCGVEQPSSLDRTSPCDELNGIGWFSESPGTAVKKAWRFTTIGRTGFIEVIVHEDVEPAGDALMDLSAAVALMPVVTPCA